jgi:hypothetical protein
MESKSNHKMVMYDIVEIIVRDKNGRIKARHVIGKSRWYRFKCWLLHRHNSITQYGMAAIARLGIEGNTTNVPPFIYINIGTQTLAVNVTDYELKAAILSARVTATTSTVSTSYASDTSQWVQTFASSTWTQLTGTSTVAEVGIFNASASLGAADGVSNAMLLHQSWAGDSLNWTQGDTIQITVKCQMLQG